MTHNHVCRPVVVSGRTGWSSANSAEHMIADRKNFRTHGSLSGRVLASVPADTGQATAATRNALALDIAAHGSVYAVFSYATTIAWITGDLMTVIPGTRYVSDARKDGEPKTSVTTAKHVHTARLACAVVRGEYDRPTDWDAS